MNTLTTKSGFTIVNDTRTLKALNKAGKIVWPKDTNSKGVNFKYVDEVDSIGMNFIHNNIKYQLRYHSGCFYPYLYRIF